MTLYITHATEAEAELRNDAISKALGYPMEATARGRACPPEPFGRTDRHARIQLDRDGQWASAEAPAEIVGVRVRVDGQDVTIDNEGAEEFKRPPDDPDPVLVVRELVR